MEDIQNRIIVNMDLNLRAVTSAKFMQGNVDSSVLECHISNGVKVVDITGESIVFKFEKKDGKYVYQDITTGVTIRPDLGTNVVECILLAQTIAVPGTVICEIFRSINGDTNSLPKFLFAVEDSLEDGILSSNYVASIDTKLVDWQTSFDQIQADYQAAIILDGQHSELEMQNARMGQATLGAKITLMDAASATNATNISSKIKTVLVTATVNSQSHIIHGLVYDNTHDGLQAFYQGIQMDIGDNYSENADKLSIDLLLRTIDSGEKIKFILYKGIK